MNKTLQTQLNPPLVYALKLRFLGVLCDGVAVNRSARHKPTTLRLVHRRFLRQRTTSRGHSIGIQVSTLPRNLKDSIAPYARLALAAAGTLKGSQLRAARYELWRASASSVLGTLNVIHRSLAYRARRRALEYLQRVLQSRSGNWRLPCRLIRVSLPWLGHGQAVGASRAAVAKFFLTAKEAYSGALPLLDPRSFRAQLCWTSSPSLGSLMRTSQRWRVKQHHATWPCTCAHRDASWPRVRCPVTGMLHVCAGQEEIPWPTELTWIARWSARTRVRP